MKQLFTTAGVLFSMTAFAQVGINNTSPKATLDITAKTTGSKPEGLIVPQLTGDQIRAASTGTTPVYGSAQKGLILFASAADTAPAGATANITAPGYYYFDGSVWQKIVTGSSLNTSLNSGNIYVGNASNVATAVTPSGDVTISNSGVTAIGTGKVTSSQIADATVANADLASGAGGIYKGDGSLSGNTTVTQGTNTLAFTSNATNGFSVDGTTFSVDAANNRVGIGTAAPSAMLHIYGTSGDHLRITNSSSDWALGSENAGGQNGIPGQSSFNITNRTGNFRAMTIGTDNSFRLGGSISVGSAAFSIDGPTNKIGIGVNVPNATLDVRAASNGSTPEGIIAPRLSLTALQGYTYDGNQTGAMVYVNSVSGTPTGQTANVTATGYYYFDGTNWQKVATGASVTDATTTAKGIVQLAGDLSGTAASPSIATSAVTSAKIADGTVANADLASGAGGIYKGSGSLSGNTTVTQGTNTLAFSSSATNGFSVAGTTLSVDGANSRVGIGTTAPVTTLTVNGIISSGIQNISTAGTVANKTVVSTTVNFVLPSAVTNAGAIIFVRNINTSGSITVTTSGGSMFNGGSTSALTSYTMNATDQTKTIIWISDGVNWTAMSSNF